MLSQQRGRRSRKFWLLRGRHWGLRVALCLCHHKLHRCVASFCLTKRIYRERRQGRPHQGTRSRRRSRFHRKRGPVGTLEIRRHCRLRCRPHRVGNGHRTPKPPPPPPPPLFAVAAVSYRSGGRGPRYHSAAPGPAPAPAATSGTRRRRRGLQNSLPQCRADWGTADVGR